MKKLKEHLEKNKKTHIIFDFDETILELLLFWDEWFSKMKIIVSEYDEEVWKKFQSGELSEAGFQNNILKRYGKVAREKMNEITEEFEISRLEGIRKNNELIEFIKANSGNYTFSIWSTNSRKVIYKTFEEIGINKSFKLIVSRDDVDYLKPNPDGFRLIDDGKTRIDQYLFIGDSSNDEGAAKALGMDFFKVSF